MKPLNGKKTDLMNVKVLRLALPSIISNITVPLLGLVDMMIVGHLGSAIYIGAVAVGGLLFNILYWNFGFLRMGTSGLASQAYGRKDFREMASVLVRALEVALGLALLFIIFRHFIADVAFDFIDTNPEVRFWAEKYFHINIWAAPAVLGLYAFKGWFIGMQNSKIPMFIAISINVVNIVLSLFFVYVLDMSIEGVALGSALAQIFGLLLAVVLWAKFYARHFLRFVDRRLLLNTVGLGGFFKLNFGIVVRTMCLVLVTSFFTVAGTKQGVVVLAVNTLMMQLFTLFSYFMDGFAYAGEALVGKYIGANDKFNLKEVIKSIFKWGGSLSLIFTVLYGLFASEFISFLTDEPDVVNESAKYYFWVLAIPFAGFSAFLWDGVCVGATAVRTMAWTMIIATVTFFSLYYSLIEKYENHAIWFSFVCYLSMRSIVQTIWAKCNLLRM